MLLLILVALAVVAAQAQFTLASASQQPTQVVDVAQTFGFFDGH